MASITDYKNKRESHSSVSELNLVPLQITGPAKNRLNLVIFGDGYTANEMDKFREDVDRNLNNQWAVEPFRSYRNHFNVYMVETPSEDTGISYDPEDGNENRDTALNLQFGPNNTPSDELERLITFGPGGKQKIDEILKKYVIPELNIIEDAKNIQRLTLANTFTYGGVGSKNATTSGGSPQGPLVSIHELGHSLGGLQDEYPHNGRNEPGDPYPDKEPDSIHHTRMCSEEMKKNQTKWWHWLGEKSTAGGTIRAADPNGHESGLSSQTNVWRPSEHSKMRWIGFPFDQVQREQLVHKISGLRNANQMPLESTPEGEVGPNDVLWVDTPHPRFHEIDVTWKINGEKVLNNHNNNYLELSSLVINQGDTIKVEVQDDTDFVRKKSLKMGPSMMQSREWTVGESLTKNKVDVEISNHSPTEYPLAKDEVVYVEIPHTTDYVMRITWKLNGEEISNEYNRLNLDLKELDIPKGSSELSATLTDPYSFSDKTDIVKWTIDNGLPKARKRLSNPLTKQTNGDKHNIYLNKFGMQLEAEDDQEGYIVSEFQLNRDGWYNYFGFPEKSLDSPFIFSHSGTDIKGITYGNLGTGGLSKDPFEQNYTEEDPGGPFIPGFGTHTIEHRAIDASGNIGDEEKFKVTVLPGEIPECTDVISGDYNSALVINEGIIRIENAVVNGSITVNGASLMIFNSSINGGLNANNAKVVQMFGTTVNGSSTIQGTTEATILAGNNFNGNLILANNLQISANEQYGEYGPVFAGNTLNGSLKCSGNNTKITDFGASNHISGPAIGQCADLGVSARSIRNLVEEFKKEGDFSNEKATESLQRYLTIASHYENQEKAGEVVQCINELQELLDDQLKNQMISNRAYSSLQIRVNVLRKIWE